MTEMKMTIRLETKDDYRNVENLTREAFWNVYRPGCMRLTVKSFLRSCLRPCTMNCRRPNERTTALEE